MSVSDVRKTQCLSYQGPRLIKFHLPATHPAHTVSKTPVCRSEGMLWQICMPSGFLELSPSCTIPCLPPRLHSSRQGLWLCTVPKTSNDSLSTCLSPRGNRKPSLESCDCQISSRPFCSQAIQKLFSRGMLAFKGHTS